MSEIRVLRDIVAAEDAFGPHSRTAEVIANHIKETDFGDTIGLEGDWGSGKSSILNFLNKNVCADGSRNIEYFLFDAWAHEGDALRKSFLDELNNKIVSDEDKKAELQKSIWAEEQTVEKNTTSTIKLRAILFALSVALIPAFNAFIGILEKKNYQTLISKIYLTTDNLWLLNMPMIGLALPFLMILAGLAWSAKLHKYGQKIPFKQAVRDTFSFLNTRNKNDIESITISSTSSFRKFKDNLLTIVKNKDKNINKIIVAIDNIDRLDPNIARQFWSSLAPFFEKAKQHEKELNCLWLIMPFSRVHLAKVFDDQEVEGNENSTTEETETDGFIRKSFDILFHVPPPLLSSWQEYLKSCLIQLFPELNSNERELAKITMLFEDRLSKESGLPTPRKIKQFANQMSTIRAQAENPSEFSPSIIACHALHGHKLTLGSKLTPKDFSISPLVRDILAKDEYEIDLVALSFGSTVANAPIALMSEPITLGLAGGDAEKLNEWQRFPHFQELLIQIALKVTPSDTENIISIRNTVEAMRELENSELYSIIWGHLGRVIPQTNNWREVEDWEDIVFTIANNLDETHSQKFLVEVNGKFGRLHEEEWGEDSYWITNYERWYNVGIRLMNSVDKLEVPNFSNLIMPFLCRYVRDGHSPNEHDFKFFDLGPSYDILALEPLYGWNSCEIIGAIKILISYDEKFIENSDTAGLLETLQDGTPLSLKDFIASISILVSAIQFNKTSTLKAALKSIYDNPNIELNADIDEISITDDVYATALLGALVCGVEDPLSNLIGEEYDDLAEEVLDNPEKHSNIIEQLVKYFTTVSTPSELLNLTLTQTTLFGFGVFLVEKTLKKTDSFIFDIGPFIENSLLTLSYDKSYNKVFGEWKGITKLLSSSCNVPEMSALIIKAGYSKKHHYLYEYFIKENNPKGMLLKFLKPIISAISTEVWIEAIKEKMNIISNDIRLARDINSIDKSFMLENNARDAIYKTTVQLFEQDITDEQDAVNPQSLQALMKLLSPSSMDNTQDDIIDAFCKAGKIENLRQLSEIFEWQTFKVNIVNAKADSLLHVIEKLLRYQIDDEGDLIDITNTLKSHPQIYKAAKVRTKKGFRERLIGAYGKLPAAQNSNLNSIRKYTGIKKPKSKNMK